VADDLDHIERWGRIVAIDSKLGPALTLHLELHVAEQVPETIKVSSNALRRRSPRVGDDVAIVPDLGGLGANDSYRIEWGKQPQYGIPTATEEPSADDPADDSFELDLQRRGSSARATVLARPEPLPGDPSRLRMPLEVEPPEGGPGHRVDCVFPASRPIERLAVGIWLPVKVDPDERDRVAVVWNLWLADRDAPPRRG
jgi:hypothetical protein